MPDPIQKRRRIGAAVFASAAALALAGCSVAPGDRAAGASAGRVEVGLLECQLTDEGGTILASERQFDCIFDPTEIGRPLEGYKAVFDRFGLDLSLTRSETIRWGVIAPASLAETGVLAGRYVGVAGDVSVGPGLGARVLVGGVDQSIALQPISIAKRDGLGASLGFETLTLTVAEPPAS